MSNFNANMNEIFDVEQESNLPEIVENKNVILHESLDEDLKKDYETARENFHELIEKGKDAVDDILSIARESERPRDFEVAATLLKNVLDANEQIINLHKKIREITNYKQQSAEKTTINNALFVGSTAELSRMVKELSEKSIN